MADRNNRRPGLRQRGSIWHIDKAMRIEGVPVRFNQSTGTSDYAEACRALDRLIEEKRREICGEREVYSWEEARDRFLGEARALKSYPDIERGIRQIDPFLHGLALHQLCDENLQRFIAYRKAQGVKNATINRSLEWIRRIVRLAHRKWRDPTTGRPWLDNPPHIGLLDQGDARPPYPISWAEQDLLFPLMPPWMNRIALFMVSAGPRPDEAVQLRWAWERRLAEGISVFALPSWATKERTERLLVPNHVGQSIIEEQRGKHPNRVFTGAQGGSVRRLNGRAWDRVRGEAKKRYTARMEAPCPENFACLHWHDLRHTFGRRLRAAGVGEETRRDLLGHASGSLTTHYSAAEVRELYEAACAAADRGSESVTLGVIKAQA